MAPLEIGSSMYKSPFRILMLNPHEGLVQAHALKKIAAPWLPKSESGTRSPRSHFWHFGKLVTTTTVLLPLTLSCAEYTSAEQG
jgi:hypothetical protein